jgi:CheY-like chemotaxis protein
MRILIAEDHLSLVSDLKKGLERCHYAVDLVANGEDALVLGFEVPYDLIILDIVLPGLDGLEVYPCLSLRRIMRSLAKSSEPLTTRKAEAMIGEAKSCLSGVSKKGHLAGPKQYRTKSLSERIETAFTHSL